MLENYFDEPVAAVYDTDSAEMFDPAVVDPTVDFLAALAGDGDALELGIGTGRIALPLRRRGVRVHGIEHLEPGGHFVIEVGIPALRRLPPGETVVPFHVTLSHLDFDTCDVANQGQISHHYWIRDRRLQAYSVPFRYVWPSELDLMARLAGMTLHERWSSWHRAPFTSESTTHVSVWKKTE